MSILVFHDLDGDPVAVEASAIVAVRAGRVERDADILHEVALITVPGCTVAVREQLADVLAMWRSSRSSSAATASKAAGWAYHDVVKGDMP